MKLLILSDIHLEEAPLDLGVLPEHDAVVLAGDIANGTDGFFWAKEHFLKPVIYVAGNHEYYKQSWGRHLQAMTEASTLTNIHFLENETFIIDDVLFIGATLWTDFSLFKTRDDFMNAAQRAIKDFNRIYNENHFILPEEMVKEHNYSKKFIKRTISNTLFKKIVVVTHFGVAYDSIAPHYRGDKLNPYYASDLEEYIVSLEEFNKNITWIHGHTHNKIHFNIGKTPVYSNPRGYPGELHEFTPLILEI